MKTDDMKDSATGSDITGSTEANFSKPVRLVYRRMCRPSLVELIFWVAMLLIAHELMDTLNRAADDSSNSND